MIWPHFIVPPLPPRLTNLCSSSMTSCGLLLTTPSFTRLIVSVAYRDKLTCSGSSTLPGHMLLMYQKHTQILKTYLPPQNFPSTIAHLEHSLLLVSRYECSTLQLNNSLHIANILYCACASVMAVFLCYFLSIS